MIFWALPNIFINTFLISLDGDVRIAYVFNIIICAVQGFAELLAARVYRAAGAKTVSRAGLALYALAYLQLLIFREQSVSVMPLIAAVSGSAARCSVRMDCANKNGNDQDGSHFHYVPGLYATGPTKYNIYPDKLKFFLSALRWERFVNIINN